MNKSNALGRNSKRSVDVYLAIRKLYCRGRTQTRTSRIIDRWARMRGLKSVTRQTIITHFYKIGEVLWYSWFTAIWRHEPKQNDRPNAHEFSEQHYLYADHAITKQLWEDKRHGMGLWKNPCFTDGTRVPGPAALIDNEVIRELRRVSARSRGIDCSHGSETFFIHWMRARILAGIKRDCPELSIRERENLLFEIILQVTPRYKPRSRREPGGNGPTTNGKRRALYTEFWD